MQNKLFLDWRMQEMDLNRLHLLMLAVLDIKKLLDYFWIIQIVKTSVVKKVSDIFFITFVQGAKFESECAQELKVNN